MLRRLGKFVALVTIMALAVTTRASAAPVAAGIWYEFCFGAAGTFAFGACGSGGIAAPAPPAPWTYISAGGGTLTIVDGYLHGDLFAPLGSIMGGPTSPPGAPGSCGADPLVCMGDPAASKGVYGFGAGAHFFDILVVASPFGGGGAFFRLEEAGGAVVPEPATFGLLGIGMLGLGIVARRRRA